MEILVSLANTYFFHGWMEENLMGVKLGTKQSNADEIEKKICEVAIFWEQDKNFSYT